MQGRSQIDIALHGVQMKPKTAVDRAHIFDNRA